MQNARPYVNAAFAMEVNSSNNFSVLGSPILVIGGGSTRPVSFNSHTIKSAEMKCTVKPARYKANGLLERSK